MALALSCLDRQPTGRRYVCTLTTGHTGNHRANDVAPKGDHSDRWEWPQKSAYWRQEEKLPPVSEQCRASSKRGYVCTLRIGHGGLDHVTKLSDGHEVDRWPIRSSVSRPAPDMTESALSIIEDAVDCHELALAVLRSDEHGKLFIADEDGEWFRVTVTPVVGAEVIRKLNDEAGINCDEDNAPF